MSIDTDQLQSHVINYELLRLLEQVLGVGKKTSGTNYSFFSPFISHHKPKLEIDLSTNSTGMNLWHCWVSDTKGRTIRTLFKRMGLRREHYDELNKVLKVNVLHSEEKIIDETPTLHLPSDYVKLSKYSSVTDKYVKVQLQKAIRYLQGRGLSAVDMIRHGIGYCVNGEYSGRVIIPSFDRNHMLNFFIARSIFDTETLKYKNPKVSKDIVGFESTINWNRPVTIVEGAFDAIAVRYNAVPLFGKRMSQTLKTTILQRKPPYVIVALDSDAKKDAIEMCDFLIANGISTKLVFTPGKDVSEIGHSAFTSLTRDLSDVDTIQLMKYRLTA